jgi:hypothetical protein
MQTVWQLSAGDEKLILALKINISRDMAETIIYLVPLQFQESIYPHNPSKKNTGSVLFTGNNIIIVINIATQV